MTDDQPPDERSAWDRVFFLQRPFGGFAALFCVAATVWLGHEAAAGWKDVGPVWAYHLGLAALGAVVGLVGANRRGLGAACGAAVGPGALLAVGLVRAVWPSAPDALLAAAWAAGLAPGFVAFALLDIRPGPPEPRQKTPWGAVWKTMPDVLLDDPPAESKAGPSVHNFAVTPAAERPSQGGPVIEGPAALAMRDGPPRVRTAAALGLAAVALGAVALLAAPPAVVAGWHLRAGGRWVDGAGYLAVVLFLFLAGKAVQFGVMGLGAAADTREPGDVAEAGVYLGLVAAAVWLGCGLAWSAAGP